MHDCCCYYIVMMKLQASAVSAKTDVAAKLTISEHCELFCLAQVVDAPELSMACSKGGKESKTAAALIQPCTAAVIYTNSAADTAQVRKVRLHQGVINFTIITHTNSA